MRTKSCLGRALINKKKLNYKIGKSKDHRDEVIYLNNEIKNNNKSITEESYLNEFIGTFGDSAPKVIRNNRDQSLDNLNELKEPELISEKENFTLNNKILLLPKKPTWSNEISKEEYKKLENKTFINWRRNLANYHESRNLTITPYEKNLAIWRELWKVIEKSDLIIQVLDSRNPLLFYCEDLTKYINEYYPKKKNLLLLNKADLLNYEQRFLWSEYFKKKDKEHCFYSSKELKPLNNNGKNLDSQYDILTREGLIKKLENYSIIEKKLVIYVGMVGFPNVGKSSTIISLLGEKKLGVSSTPGKTKYMQTHYISKKICLCDCPGLVFPVMKISKAEMILSGILIIDELKDYISPAKLIIQRIPKDHLIRFYKLNPKLYNLKSFNEIDLLSEYANIRGFKNGSSGNFDISRASKIIFKDYVNGLLCYVHLPPNN